VVARLVYAFSLILFCTVSSDSISIFFVATGTTAIFNLGAICLSWQLFYETFNCEFNAAFKCQILARILLLESRSHLLCLRQERLLKGLVGACGLGCEHVWACFVDASDD
jgi:hypothetical protein